MRSFFIVGESEEDEMEVFFSVSVDKGQSVLKVISQHISGQKKINLIPKDFNLLSVELEED